MLDLGRFVRLAAAAAFAGVISVGAAPAATMINYNDGEIRGTLSCSIGCEVWLVSGTPTPPDTVYPGGWNGGTGSMMDPIVGGVITPSGTNMNGPQRETFVENLTGNTFSGTTMTAGGGNVFNSGLSEYLLFWVGQDPRYGLIRVFAEGNLITWTPEAGAQGTAVSGVEGFGIIPLPATGWLLLSTLGLGGLVAHRKRKQKKVA
jgi:hypothetical protein